MNIKNSIVNKVIKVAQKSDVVRGKIGAILFNNSGNILASSCNKTLFGGKENFTIHAEEALLSKILRLKIIPRFRENNLNILVVRWKPSINGLGNAKPCVRCQYLLKKLGIPIYYSAKNGQVEKLK
jgi:hypothetical protein